MRLIRFMSGLELFRYQKGATIRSMTSWRLSGFNSDSVGICFFDDSERPEERLSYVSGLVDTEVAAVFETVPFSRIQPVESEGVYRDTDRDMPTLTELLSMDLRNLKARHVREWCLPEYSMQTLRLVRYGYPARGTDGWVIEWKGAEHESHQEAEAAV